MISPGRLWWLFRRDLKRGWTASYHYHRTLPKITAWRSPLVEKRAEAVPIHLLTGINDWRLAAWMLASFFHFTQRSWSVFIHDDGTLPAEARETLTLLFPQTRIISRAEADAAMANELRNYPRCQQYRQMHPLAQKIFDVPFFTTGKQFMLLDSDLLFFARPEEILHWVDGGEGECWFNADADEAALLSKDEAKSQLGVDLWPKVNSGLCLISKSAVDRDFLEHALATTNILEAKVWRIEQTLYALTASRHGKGGLLPATYEVSLGKTAAPNALARHYVGAVRDHFYGEGLRRLLPILLP